MKSKKVLGALATGGLWESSDAGAQFTEVRDDNVLFPTAVQVAGGTRLLAVDANGVDRRFRRR